MAADLDRFDRMLLGVSPASPTRTTYRMSTPAPQQRSPMERTNERRRIRYALDAGREPVITSTRGSRFVDYMDCPMCGAVKLGIEFHGELMSGAKVHQLAAHAAGKRSVPDSKSPRCRGAAMRVDFVDGNWRGVKP